MVLQMQSRYKIGPLSEPEPTILFDCDKSHDLGAVIFVRCRASRYTIITNLEHVTECTRYFRHCNCATNISSNDSLGYSPID